MTEEMIDRAADKISHYLIMFFFLLLMLFFSYKTISCINPSLSESQIRDASFWLIITIFMGVNVIKENVLLSIKEEKEKTL